MPSCSCCEVVDETHKIIDCCICKKRYRIDCVKVSPSEARKIHLNTGFSWTCKNCLQFGNDLNSVKSIIVSLQDEIKSLKQSLLDFQSTSSNPPSLLDTEKVIQEIADRDRRKVNLMVYGSKESCESKTNKDQISLDVNLANNICSTLGVNDPTVKVFRLGKFDPTNSNRRRPIKISFASESVVNNILRNVDKLKSNPVFASLSFSRDRTPMQIKIYKDVRTELTNRLNSGESNLRIKYNRGIPSIISSLN